MNSYEVEGIGTIVYHEYGNGDQYLFAFHGYGMNGKQFQNLPSYLLSKYKVIGINLFFHEGSEIKPYSLEKIRQGMAKNDILKLIEPFLTKYKIQEFAIAGYSIGSNFALTLMEYYADRIKQIYLFAPDGIQPNAFLKNTSNNPFWNYIFYKIAYHQSLLPFLLKISHQLHLLNNELFSIAYAEVDTLEKRKAVYNCMTYQKNIVPDIEKVESNIRKYEIPVVLIYGKRDGLFPLQTGSKFLVDYPFKKLYNLDFGHFMIIPSLDEALTKQA
jgi:pimeloyl-ACP methyl ester carboxylesterase